MHRHLRRLCVDACPARRRRRPDRHRGIDEIWMVEAADADEDQMRPRLRLAEERSPARGAESPMHLVAAVRDTRIVARLAGHCERRCTKTGVDRPTPGADVLTVPAPANTGDNRRRRAFPADFPTETSTCHRHSLLHSTTAKPLIADATLKAASPANHAFSPRLHAHSTLERPLSAICVCSRSWPGSGHQVMA